MEVADSIVVLNEGRIEQIGTPVEIYDDPTSPFVMRFVGEVNVLPAAVLSGATTPPCQAEATADDVGNGTVLFIRPHDLDLLEEPGDSSVPAVVRRLVHLGRDVHAELQLIEGHLVHVQIPREWLHTNQRRLEAGTRLHLRPRSVRSFPS